MWQIYHHATLVKSTALMSTAQGSQDRAAVDAAGAASYWRGRHVRQEEELNLPSPEIEIEPWSQGGQDDPSINISITGVMWLL